MRETKLKRWILGIYIGMVVLLVAMVLVWKLRFYDKVNADISKTDQEKKLAKEQADKLGTAIFAEAKANEKLILAQSQVDYFRTRFRSLSFDLTSLGARNATWIRYMNEYFADFGLAARSQLIAAADESGVIINTKVSVDPPPQVPEQVFSPPSGYLKPVVGGTIGITVTGSLPNILRFFERINRAQILMTVGNVKLDGVSPNITASTTITPYLVASGPSAQLAAPAGAAPVDPNNPEGLPPGEGAPPPGGP